MSPLHLADYAADRKKMVTDQLEARDIRDRDVLSAFARVPREEFVLKEARHFAYHDGPLEIGHGATISQPWVVARTIEAAAVRAGDRVLEIGTGSGYQTAILAQLGARIATIEIVPELSRRAQDALARVGYSGIRFKIGDGQDGWPGHEKFDAILLSAAPLKISDTLLTQLAEGGRLVGPEGSAHAQWLVRITQTPSGFFRERLDAVRFVPMLNAPA